MTAAGTEEGSAVRPLGKAERTRLRLVDAVRRTIAAEGTISAGSVARRAETSPATFYNHFSSHDEAVVEAFSAAMRDLVDFVEAELDVVSLLELGIEVFLEGWTWRSLDFFRANSAVFDMATAAARRSPAIRDVYRRREAEALEHYERFVRLGQRAGQVRGGEGDAPAIAEALMLLSESWNHPRVLRCERGGALHRELVRVVHTHLVDAEAPDPGRTTTTHEEARR